jgi:hypothetical protein
MPLEASASLGANKQAVGADAFLGAFGLGPTISSFRGSYRRGLSDHLELRVAPALSWIHGAERRESSGGIYSARGSVKYAFVPHFSLDGGLGGGYSAGGAFATPDVGLTASYDNPYLVPFAAARGFLSLPFARTNVRIYDTYEGDEGGEYLRSLKPKFTYGHQLALGLRLKMHQAQDPRPYPTLACAVTGTGLYDDEESEGVFGAACGMDVTF